MAPFVIPVVLGVAGIGLIYELLLKKKPAPSGPGGSPAKPGSPGSPGSPSSPNMPGMPGIPGGNTTDAAYRKQVHDAVMDLLANGKDPDAMDAAANELAQYGFTEEASALHLKAASLRARPAPANPTQPTPSNPQPSTPAVVPAPVLTPSFATVTTSGPVGDPLSDLKIHAGPSAGSPSLGAATKNGTVTIVNWNADATGEWAQIVWLGDSNRPAAAGYSSKQYLIPSGSAPVPAAPQVMPVSPPSGGAVGTAVVTTSGPAGDPLSDLKVHSEPNASSPSLGGASKNGTVTVLNWHAGDGTWAKISWPGDDRRPPVEGYSAKAFLVPTAAIAGEGNSGHPSHPYGHRKHHHKKAAVKVAGMVGAEGRTAKIVAPAGMRLRAQPTEAAQVKAMIPAGTEVRMLKMVPAPKVNFRAPGPGGWAMVEYHLTSGPTQGWVHAEWLALDA